MPATIQMLEKLASNGSPLMISGQEIGNVEIVGSVRKIEQREPTKIVFFLDDSTGCINCQYWTPLEQIASELTENSYVRVFGKYDKGEMAVYGVKMVADFNEIAHHYLAAMYNYKTRSEAKANPVQQQQGERISFNDGQNGNSADDEAWANIPYGKNIMGVLKGCNADVGMEITDIINATGLTGVDAELKGALAQLSEDGCIYTTVDEEHFAAAS